jgi:hypothetical protein
VVSRSGNIVDTVAFLLGGLKAGFLTTTLRGRGGLGEEARLLRKWTNEGWVYIDKMTRS